RPPAEGVMLTRTQPTLGEAVVEAGGKIVPLAAMIASGALRIEGLGSFANVRLRNTTDATLTICFDQPTVVMAVDGSAGALPQAYSRIKTLLTDADPGRHEAAQHALWDLVEEAERDEAVAAAARAAPPSKPAKGPKQAAQGREDCAGRPGAGLVCLER